MENGEMPHAEKESLRDHLRKHHSLKPKKTKHHHHHQRHWWKTILSKADIITWTKIILCCSMDTDGVDSEYGDLKIDVGIKFLKSIEAFEKCTEQELRQLAQLTELRSYTHGEIIVDNERLADGLYIVLTGNATRSHMEGNKVSNELPKEVLEFQQVFGAPLIDEKQPNEEESDDEDSANSNVVASSGVLECIWLPLLVVRMMNLRPRMEFEFVVVLKNAGTRNADDEYRQQEEIVSSILHAGIHVTVMSNTRNTTNKIILCLRAPLWLLAREDKLMKMERIVEYHSEEDAHALGGEYGAHAESMTPADRIQAFASILTRSSNDKPPGAGLQGIEENQDYIVHDVFPLHDPSVSDFITTYWFDGALQASTRRLFLLRTKDYFGLRVAFYTAFVRLYTASLMYPMIIGAIMWLFWKHIDYASYVAALGIYGLLVAFAWAPSVMKRWKRYQNALCVDWDLLQAKEVEYPNPQFRDYVVETLNVANDGDTPDFVDVKVYDHRRRWPKFLFYFIFCIVCLLLLFVFVGIFVQWYIVAVMTPMCLDPRCEPESCLTTCAALVDEQAEYRFIDPVVFGDSNCTEYCDPAKYNTAYYQCEWLIGCFNTERGILGTGRWVYIFIQGVALGLTLDIVFLAIFELIASFFNKWENYATIQERERRYVEKIFVFNWVGYFYWFFLLAFLYVPYGDTVQGWIRENIDSRAGFTFNGTFKYSRYWVDGLIAMDSAFVTPLIVTQLLNMLINTFVPYLLRTALLKGREKYHVRKDQLSAGAKKVKRVAHRAAEKSHLVKHHAIKRATSVNVQAKRSVSIAKDRMNTMKESVESVYNRKSSGTLETTVEPIPAVPSAATSNRRSDAIDPMSHTASVIQTNFSTLQVVTFDDEAERGSYAATLADRPAIPYAKVEETLNSLLVDNNDSHDNHMSQVCSDLRRESLDIYQVTSYDWIDRITRAIDKKNQHQGVWENTSSGTISLRLITNWRCRNYNYTADKIMEESSMPVYNTFGDLLHMAIQFSYVIMFSVVWPFCALCAFFNNSIALHFDAIKMIIDCKRGVPRRTVGIGPWNEAFMFEILIAGMIVPGLFAWVSGQLDAFNSNCTISIDIYGPVEFCFTSSQRLIAFSVLENIGIGICFLVYLKKSDISTETSIKIQQHGRKLKHNLRKSVRSIGETILIKSNVTDKAWQEGTVAWVQNGKVKVNFNQSSTYAAEHERWLHAHELYVVKTPVPVTIFTLHMPVLYASSKPGMWHSGTIVDLDTRDHCGQEIEFQPNHLFLEIHAARNLRSSMIRGVVDPYAIITCQDATFKHTTSIKRHTMNPVWEESLTFPLMEKTSTIKVVLFNHDSLSLGECIGEITLEANDLADGVRVKKWYTLQQRRRVLSMEGWSNAVSKMAGNTHVQSESPDILLEMQWIDTRFPTRISVQSDAQESKIKVLSRRFCEKRLCHGIVPDEIHHGRLFRLDEAGLT